MLAGFFNYQTSSSALYSIAVQDLEYITTLKANELNQVLDGDSTISTEKREELNEIIQDVHQNFYQPSGLSGYGYVIDEKGIAQFHLNPDLVNFDTSEFDWAKEILSTKTGYYEYPWDGEMRVASYEELNNGWIFAITLPLDDLYKPIEPVKKNMFILSFIFSLAAIIIGFFIVNKITNPMKELVKAMKVAETGDLRMSVNVSSTDEVGQLSKIYNEMIASIKRMLHKMQDVSEQVAASSEQLTANANESARASEQIAISSTEIAHSSEQQLESASDSTDSINSMSEQINSIINHVHEVNQKSKSATTYAEEGETYLKNVITEMGDITEKSGLAHKMVNHLGERSESIKGIISTIYDISEQTNLLALNAAIEAARAGEQGKSFAVVADEIRKLAAQSSKSASEIADLIEQINKEIYNTILAMKENTEAVGDGQQVVIEASESFNKIITAIEDVNSQISEVTHSATEIGEGTRKIVSSSEQIMNLSQNVASGTEEVAASSEEQTATMEEITASSEMLARMAEELQTEVNKFKI
ncbi:methyl-accepting chemotaxis protein [Bacillus sp. FJAT-45350]|uniref:methyl-accepting chemotaxis protein n=1 Tax=Bacillus sp. FJAT-45350 TaxID=2011014 RepID=UPI00359C935F